MLQALAVSQVLVWLVIVGLGVLCLALARQIGVLHQRIAPMGAMMVEHGPPVHSAAPQVPVHTLSGMPLTIGAPSPDGDSQLLLFVSPDCPLCRQLIPVVQRFARRESIETLFIGDDSDSRLRKMVLEYGLEMKTFINSAAVGRIYHVDKLPYAVLLTSDGRIAAKGLVNSHEHLESLIAARDSGFSSIQDYLNSRTG